MYPHFMMDLETRGFVAGCHVLSVGLIRMDLDAKTVDDLFVDDGYYGVISRESCNDALLHEDRSTMGWWAQQSNEARQVLADSEDPQRSKSTTEVLNEMVAYVGGHCAPSTALVWGNGADFDNPILNTLAYQSRYKAPGAAESNRGSLPWKWGNRCYRTIKNLGEILAISRNTFPKLSGRQGTYHNALDDAKSQAVHMYDIVCTLRDLVKK